MELMQKKLEKDDLIFFDMKNFQLGMVVGFTDKLIKVAYVNYHDEVVYTKKLRKNIVHITANDEQYVQAREKIQVALEKESLEKFELL